jgi:hypothetical protein
VIDVRARIDILAPLHAMLARREFERPHQKLRIADIGHAFRLAPRPASPQTPCPWFNDATQCNAFMRDERTVLSEIPADMEELAKKLAR